MSPSLTRSWQEELLSQLELWYGPTLLIVFVVGLLLNSVLAGTKSIELIKPAATGPGGRPLPATRRKSQDTTLVTFASAPEVTRPIRNAYCYGTTLVIFTFLGQFVNILHHCFSAPGRPGETYGWWCGEEKSVYLMSGLFIHLYALVYLLENKRIPNKPVAVFWALSLVEDAAILATNIFRVTGYHQVLRDVTRNIRVIVHGPDKWDNIDVALSSVRVVLLFALVAIYFSVSVSRSIKLREKTEQASQTSDNDDYSSSSRSDSGASSDADETTPLVANGNRNTYDSARGADTFCHRSVSCKNGANGSANNQCDGTASIASSAATESREGDGTAFYRPKKLPHKTWWEYLSNYSLFFPYLWPRESGKLKLGFTLCFGILVLQRIVNLLVPNQIGNITDAFESRNGLPWQEIMLLIFYKLLQGQAGILGSVRALLWIPVSQYSYRALITAAFEHVHSLSLDFHIGKRTGEVLSVLNKGASINTFLEQITFQVIPMLIDLIVAIVYFLLRFGAIYATIATIITVFYLHMTVKMASTRVDLRRDMVNADREEEAVKNDSVTNYETVKYFNAEEFEFKRYRDAIHNFQTAEAKVMWGMNGMNICQSLVFMCGIVVMLLVAGIEVSLGMRSIGDFVIMITYLGQLQGPLNFFGTFYRTVQQAMISGERLLELFKVLPTVLDRPGVPSLPGCNGHIRWSNVRFAYDNRRTALRDLSFDCHPGTTTAFVGESGGGKSTIFRLMFRYYNCHSGSIEIDGHNVKDVTIDSVRRHIGVVPQDTILFNETIMYNLKYANQNATDEEVYRACKAASIHDRILAFPDGYNTKVGDRGARLSGGEKQRVAIARTILKNPKIIMLDEATSALDSETEQMIQSKLIQGGSLGQDRTILVIAHRLSTIIHADQIIVLHAGAIVEKGTHSELLALKGRYASMWEKQSQAEQAAVSARYATIRSRHHHSSKVAQGDDDSRSGSFKSLSSSALLATGLSTPPRQNSLPPSETASDDECQPRMAK